MSDHGRDNLVSCLSVRQDMKLRNVRFARGSEKTIEEDDFRAQICSAATQHRDGSAVESGWPKTTKEKVDVRTFIANI